MGNYSVYKHTCPNNKVYIGITCRNPEYRWNNGKGYKNNKHFYSAIQKYGWENIKHEILYKELEEREAYKKEIELIKKHQSNNRKYGYNNSTGGEKSMAGCTAWNKGTHITNSGSFKKGHKLSEKSLEKIKNAIKGRKLTEETKKKMSEAQKGEKCYWYGKQLPEYMKEKIRQGHNKKVICIETNIIYESIKIAEQELGLKHIGDCCRGKQKQCGCLHFKFIK